MSPGDSDLQPGQTYFLVGSFNQDSPFDESSLWIDPALGLTSPPGGALTSDSGETGGFNDNSVAVFDITSNTGLPNSGVLVGDVTVGTSFADVDPAPVSVPEPSSLMLLGTAAVALLAFTRRRSLGFAS